MIKKIINGKIITDIIEKDKTLYIEDNKILAITNENLPYDKIIDAKNQYVSPGFIDIHTHGGGGYDFMDGGVNPVVEGARMHLNHGTTSIMPTTLSSGIEELKSAISNIGKAMKIKDNMPNIIGAHLEGPYFSLNQSGAQNPKYIKNPKRDEYEELLEYGDGIIKRWSFAPELDGSEEFCKALMKRNIVPSIAHSDAEYDDIMKISGLGCKLVTHLYSGMSTITRRKGYRHLGVVESAYLIDDMMVEVIADGMHLPSELLKLIYKFKGADKICLVTDSMRGAGMSDGPSILGSLNDGMDCIIEDGIAKLTDKTAFAGSVATSDRLIRTFVKQVGVGVAEAVKMMTENPAKVMGLNNKGSLKKGYDADIVMFNEDINITMVMLSGNICKES